MPLFKYGITDQTVFNQKCKNLKIMFRVSVKNQKCKTGRERMQSEIGGIDSPVNVPRTECKYRLPYSSI